MVIVIHLPAIHNVSPLSQAEEQFAVEAFVPQLAVEALNVPILPRGTGFDEQRSDSQTFQPFLYRLARKLRAIVAPDVLRTTSQQELPRRLRLTAWHGLRMLRLLRS
jgi:hypothetical protein